MIRLVRWLWRFEVGIWRSLFLWITRRVPGRGPGVEELSYAKEVAPLLAVFVFVSLVELPVVHLLIPWDSVRLVVLVLSVWGLLWMIGLLASVKVFPHLVGPEGLRVRYGAGTDIAVPWDAVESVGARRRRRPDGGTVEVEDGAVSVAVLKQTRVDVELRGPTRLELPGGPQEVTAVWLYADDPKAFVAAARQRLAAARAS